MAFMVSQKVVNLLSFNMGPASVSLGWWYRLRAIFTAHKDCSSPLSVTANGSPCYVAWIAPPTGDPKWRVRGVVSIMSTSLRRILVKNIARSRPRSSWRWSSAVIERKFNLKSASFACDRPPGHGDTRRSENNLTRPHMQL